MKTCDHQSVGVIITNERGEHLLLTRAKPPAGRAPVAGHVDEHGGVVEAALAEVREGVGIKLAGVDIYQAAHGPMTNICRRPPSHPTHDGHYWTIFKAQVDSTVQIRFDADETRSGRWVSQARLQELADRTVSWSIGGISDRSFNTDPGLEPVWVAWLAHTGHIAVGPDQLDGVRAIYSEPPA